jgi:hypothetical protein
VLSTAHGEGGPGEGPSPFRIAHRKAATLFAVIRGQIFHQKFLYSEFNKIKKKGNKLSR